MSAPMKHKIPMSMSQRFVIRLERNNHDLGNRLQNCRRFLLLKMLRIGVENVINNKDTLLFIRYASKILSSIKNVFVLLQTQQTSIT
jgi:hypothetical protein